jgi:hypothetical protein
MTLSESGISNNGVIFWKCISPCFTSANPGFLQPGSGMKRQIQVDPNVGMNKKICLEQDKEYEDYQKSREAYFQLLGNPAGLENKVHLKEKEDKMEFITSPDGKDRLLKLPSEDEEIMMPYFQRLDMPVTRDGPYLFVKIQSNSREEKVLLNDIHRLRVTHFSFEKWYSKLSGRSITSLSETKYCPVYEAIMIPLTIADVENLRDAYDLNNFNRNVLDKLVDKIDNYITEKYGPEKKTSS